MLDPLGDRLKGYEAVTTSRKAFRGQPFVIRLDGKAFHTYTKNLERPYDKRLSDLMIATTRALVEEFGALVGYTQSDEITLGFYLPSDSKSEYPFGGRFHKLESLTAAYCSAYFNRQILPTRMMPIFDSRAFVVPSLFELYHVFLWRQNDATRNAISMAAQANFSPKALLGVSSAEKQEMLFQKGINFNDYPAFFKRGTFLKRTKHTVELTPEQLEKIPEHRRPTGPIERHTVKELDIWLSKEDDPVTRLFHG